tara:strand:+ start:130 stop:975 length:846 start_codon:yes stop_codon:yes gene_type:complete
MAEEKIICNETGKLISGYDGEIQVDVKFGDECRYYIFHDIVLYCVKGKLDIAKSFSDHMDNYEIDEVYPKITAEIISPFSDTRIHIILRDNSLEEELQQTRNLDPSWYPDIDSLEEAIEFSESINLHFHELHLKSTYGKYRGYMTINFKNINTTAHLLNAIEDEALEKYEWYDEPTSPDLFNGWLSGVEKNYGYNTESPEDLSQLLEEMGYFIRNNKHEHIVEMIENYINSISSNELNKEIEYNSWMEEKGYKSINDIIEGEFSSDIKLKDFGDKIISLLK